MIVTLIQNAPTLSKTKNIQKIKQEIAKYHNSDLLIFPELSLNGYGLKDGVFDNYFQKSEILDLVKDVRQDIILSCAFLDNNKIYNSALYISKSKILHVHHKNYLPNYTLFQEARFFSKGKKLSSFDTMFGKMMIVICEDLWSSKTIHRISKQSPDVVVVVSASPSRNFDEKLLIQEQWDSILKTTSLLSRAYCLFVNRVGFEDGLGFWGGSKVILPNSTTLKECKLFKEDALSFNVPSLDKNLFEKYTKGLK